MDKEYEQILRDTYKSLTLIQDFHFVNACIVDLSRNEKFDHDRVFKTYYDKLGNKDFKDTLNDYYKESRSAGVFANQKNILANYLVKFHFINAREFAGGDGLTGLRVANEKYIKESCEVLAKDLLNGNLPPMTELAAKEAASISEQLRIQKLENKELKLENTSLKVKLNNVNNSLNNLVSNIKSKFKLTDPEIETLKNINTLKSSESSVVIKKSESPKI